MNQGFEMGTSNFSHSQVEQIFSEAKNLDSEADRDSLLERKCGGNQELRKEIEELLRVHLGDESFLQCPALEEFPATTIEPLSDVSDLGQTIGNYRLLQKLGEGGMGTVYMAEQTKPIRRRVAIKVIKPGMDSKQIAARFEAERQALAMMDHPNIAKVLDAGCTEDGKAFFVMELVKGVPITQFCDENRLTTRQRLEIFLPVCHAVQHAHQKGIVHRDLKPSNVIVALYDDRPVAKVIDFGVAKATNQQLTDKTLFTMVGQIVGTWEYMSPEQAVLNQLDVDTRSDVYSLGVLLYELLTGVPPIDSSRLREAGLAETLRMIREEEPPKPSTRLSSLGQAATAAAGYRRTEKDGLIKSVRGDLDWVVMKAIEKDRTRRYQTPLELAADIQHHMSDEPVNARAPSTWYRFGKYARRNRGLVASVGAVFLALMLGLVFALSAKREAIAERQVAIEQRRSAEASEAKLQIQNEVLASAIESIRESRAEQILEYALSGDSAQALREFETLKSSYPNSPDDTRLLLCEAIIDLFKSDADRTSARDKLLTMGTDDLAVHSLLVASHYYAGVEWDYWKEVGALIDREPQSFEEFLFRGFALSWGVPDQAVSDLEEAKKLKPSSAVARVLLSNAYHRLSQHTIERGEAFQMAKQAAFEGNIAKEILFQDSPFAVAKRVNAHAKILSLARLMHRPEDEVARYRHDLEDVMQVAEEMPYDPQHHFALLTASRVLLPETFGDYSYLHGANSPAVVSPQEQVVVSVEELQYHYFHQELDKCLDKLSQSKEEMLQAQSMVLLIEAESRYPAESIEAIAADCVAQLASPSRDPELNGSIDWALLRLLKANETAEVSAARFRDFVADSSRKLEIAGDLVSIARFMSGDRSVAPEHMLTEASTNRAVTGIAFWLGVDRLAEGRRSEAKRYFERVVEADFFELYDYAWSRAFLTRISDREWLPWLPNDHSLEDGGNEADADE